MTGVKRPAAQQPASARSDSASSLKQAGEIEPVTASEIRTKLELARQFLDIGDPESARHMLDEVLNEGDASQKQEAMRLIDSLP